MLPLLSICWAHDINEIKYLLSDYLFETKQYITDPNSMKITPRGWEFLDSLRQVNPNSSTAFVAMKFDEKLKDYNYKYVFPAIKNCGSEPIRIDKVPHNNVIDDEIMAKMENPALVGQHSGNQPDSIPVALGQRSGACRTLFR